MTQLKWSIAQRSWLPLPPENFGALCRAAATSAEPSVALRALANYALEEPSLVKLATAACTAKARFADGQLPGFHPFALGVVSNATTAFVTPCLRGTALRQGLDLTVTAADYGQVIQEALRRDSIMRTAAFDAIFVALDHRGIPGLQTAWVDDEESALAEATEYMKSLMRAFQQDRPRTLIFCTVVCPPSSLFGSLDWRLSRARRRRVARFNLELADMLEGTPHHVFDVAGLAECVGTELWFDEAKYHAAKIPFALDYAPLYADGLTRLLAAMRGILRKCLVLDLDNTLWGGVVGDDGVAGLTLGQGSPEGEAFLAVQQMALDLRSRGVVLAVSSKNDDEIARGPFREHPDMLLREEHIAIFQANWKDKASNLEAIAKALDIGLDSLVLLDDNPVEREQVRQALPQVAVPELPADPALYPRAVLSGGFFETLALTAEDLSRASSYQANAQRASLLDASRNLDDFLASLNTTMRVSPSDAAGRDRIVQLINRSNQFNLTTHRYEHAQVAALEADPSCAVLQFRLVDKFGDNGMISVVIVRADGSGCWTIDTWLMSCRVLNRRVEEAALDVLVELAKGKGGYCLVGRYIPTPKNGLVKDHYRRLGFDYVGEDREGADVWRLDVSSYQQKRPPIAVIADFPTSTSVC